MADDAAYIADLQSWLSNVQRRLQATMDEINKKLEEPRLLEVRSDRKESKIAWTESAGLDDMMVCGREATLRDTGQSTEPSGTPLQSLETGKLESSDGNLEIIQLRSEERLDIADLVEEEPGLKKVQSRKDVFQSFSSSRRESRSSQDTQENGVPQHQRERHWLKDCLFGCLRRLPLSNSRSSRAWANKVKPVDASHVIKYSKEEDDALPFGKYLRQLRKRRSVRTSKLWKKRVYIQDATGKDIITDSCSLRDIEEHPEILTDYVFPLHVYWRWLAPDEPHLFKVNWKHRLWWKLTGFFSNIELRAFSLAFHARMQHVEIKVRRLTRGIIKDVEVGAREDAWCTEEKAIDALAEIDDLLSVGIWCDNDWRTIGEVAEAAGCSWDAFLASYMKDRNDALLCTTNGCHECRRELINAAVKGTDGLELLFQQLVHEIDNNELMYFKLFVLLVNAITCVSQFAWSDFLVPMIEPTTPMPTWQKQIADIYNSSKGG